MYEADSMISEVAARFSENWQIPSFDRYDAAFHSLGYPMDAIYKRLGLNPEQFSEIKSGIFVGDFLNILAEIIDQTSDNCVGIKLGTMRPVKKIGTRFYIALFSNTLRSALNDFLFYTSLNIPFIKIRMEESKSEATILFEYDIESPLISYEFDIDLITVVNLIRELLLRPEWSPTYVSSKYYVDPGRSDALAALVHCPVDKNAANNCITFPKDILDEGIKFYDPLAKSIMIEAFYKRWNEMYSGYEYAVRTAFFIAKYFEYYNGIVDLNAVASSFNMSVSAYQRELVNEGSSFRKIKSDFIFKLATLLIANDRDYNEVSKILGYSTPQSLARFLDSYNI